MIEAPRLRLRNWREADRDAFAALNADTEVMADLGGPLSRAASNAKFERYADAFRRDAFCRWAVETIGGDFLGYCGVMVGSPSYPLGPHLEVGWRLARAAWGRGYATEAAAAALKDAFARTGAAEILAYTGPCNLRSQAVMKRLELARDVDRDFVVDLPGHPAWRGLIWCADRADW